VKTIRHIAARCRRETAFSVGAVMVALLALTLSSSTAPAAARSRSRGVVVSPLPGQRFRTGTVWIRVRAGNFQGDLQVWLNGRSIGPYFGFSYQGIRSLQVSSSFGLRYGLNDLHVIAAPEVGRSRSVRERFWVSRSAPMAAAGPDVSVAVGSRVRLNARDSLVAGPPAAETADSSPAGPKLAYSWRLIGAPSTSDVRQSKLTSARSATPSFTPDVPGVYTFELTVSDQFGSGQDRVTVDAVEPDPLIPIDTMVKRDGHWGVQVGNDFYEADPTGEYFAYLQVVVLKRRTLELVSNTSYHCARNGFEHICPQPIEPLDFGKLDSSDLVIAVSQPSFKYAPRDDALGALGYARVQFAANGGAGMLSVIGVPRSPKPPAGSAVQRVVSRKPPFSQDPPYAPDGRLTGYLTRDNFNNYEFVSADHPSFDLRAAGSDDRQNVIELGAIPGQAAQRFSHTLANGEVGGFQMVVADAYTLKGQQFWFPSCCGLNNPYSALTDMADKLEHVNADGDKLVFIRSLGHTAVDATSALPPLGRFESALAKAGGTAQVFGRVALASDLQYGMVGASNLGPGRGLEASAAIAPSLADGRLRGMLTRGNDQRFEVETDGPPLGVAQEAYAAPSQWPEQSNPDRAQGKREAAAIAWIGNQSTVNLGSDPRAAYWIQPYGEGGGAYWLAKSNAISALEYTANNDFTKEDLDWAKKELRTEISWLIQEHYYLQNLSAPFLKVGLKEWSQLTSIADTIKGKVDVKGEDKTTLVATSVFSFLFDLGGAVPGPVGKVFEVVGAAYRLTTELASLNQEGAPADTEFQDTVNKLGEQLAKRLTAAQDAFDNLAQIIAGDYDKLKTVGTLGNCVPGANNCPREWQFTDPDQKDATTGLRASLELSFYGGLLPLKYQVWFLPTGVSAPISKYSCFRQTNNASKNAAPRYSRYTDTPFVDEPTTGWTANPLPSLDGGFRQLYQVWALGYRKQNKFDDPSMTVPSAAITDRVFGKVDPGGDLNHGGLGAFAPLFFIQNDFKTVDWTPSNPNLSLSDCAWK
jgi:hypothetical protein